MTGSDDWLPAGCDAGALPAGCDAVPGVAEAPPNPPEQAAIRKAAKTVRTPSRVPLSGAFVLLLSHVRA